MTSFSDLASMMQNEETEKLHAAVRSFIKEQKTGVAYRLKWIEQRQAQIQKLEELYKTVESEFNSGSLTLAIMQGHAGRQREILSGNTGLGVRKSCMPKRGRDYEDDEEEVETHNR